MHWNVLKYVFQVKQDLGMSYQKYTDFSIMWQNNTYCIEYTTSYHMLKTRYIICKSMLRKIQSVSSDRVNTDILFPD